MRSVRRHRSWIARSLVLLLLFVQWATASYACPRFDVAAGGGSNVPMAVMPDCTGDMSGMDPVQPQLCKAHCEAGQQSVNSGAGLLDAPPALGQGGAWAGVLDIVEAADRAATMPPVLAAGPPRGALPIYLRLLVLRN